jgi:hypothetical protein
MAVDADWPERADACTTIARINGTGERFINTPRCCRLTKCKSATNDL